MEFPMKFPQNRKIKKQLKSIEIDWKKVKFKKIQKTVKNDLFSCGELASVWMKRVNSKK